MNFCDETYYQNFAGALLKEVLADEILSLQVVGEENQFTRFNGGKVRQTGFIKNGVVEATLIAGHDGKYNKSSFLLQISGDSNHDIATAKSQLKHLRRDLENLPLDPYIKCPVGENQSHQVKKGSIPSPEKLTEHVLKEGSKLDLVGLLSAGQCVRGLFDSVGNRHWFSVNSFNVDY